MTRATYIWYALLPVFSEVDIESVLDKLLDINSKRGKRMPASWLCLAPRWWQLTRLHPRNQTQVGMIYGT